MIVIQAYFIFVYQVVEGIKPTLLELQKFETAPEDVELEGMDYHRLFFCHCILIEKTLKVAINLYHWNF